MNTRFLTVMTAFFCLAATVPAQQTVPTEWVDPDTGHRVVRLSREPGSESLYFHQNAFTAAGDKMVITTPGGISTVNLKTREVELVVSNGVAPINHGSIIVGKRSRLVYYTRRVDSNTVVAFATHLDTKATREIGKVPGHGSTVAVNADETLLAGTITDSDKVSDEVRAAAQIKPSERKGTWMQRRLATRLPMRLFTLNIKTGKSRTFHPSTDWLNHLQLSPTDPSLIMFCHEGPWHLVDRTWIIRTDGSGLKQVHPRTMEMEIAGHEFFGADGKTIWYDLQTPRGEDFWLAGYEVATGLRTWYHLQRDEWSVHYNVSPDGTLFAGDGGHEGSVAKAKDGKWIYLFRPELIHASSGEEPSAGKLIRPGIFHSERLVNMRTHDYGLEPNVNFTPDARWIVFRSNMFGSTNVFAVEVAKVKP